MSRVSKQVVRFPEALRSSAREHGFAKELTDFLENAAMPIHFVGPDGTILWANGAELALLGYTAEEYIGHNITEFHADEPVITDILRRLTTGQELHDCEARLRAKDGSIRYVCITSNVHWQDGQFLHTRCFTRDITEQKQAAELRERLAAIVESSDDAIISKGLDGIIRTWNKGAERIFGYTAEEIIGQHISVLTAPEQADEIPDILDRIRGGERIDHYKTKRRAKDGRVVTVSLTVSPVRDGCGNIVGASKVARDITEQEKAEERQRALEQELMLLIEASGALLASPQPADVLDRILDTVSKSIVADAYAVWRKQGATGLWKLIISRGLSDAYERTAAERAGGDSVPAEPLAIEDVEQSPLIAHRAAVHRAEGIRSLLSVPLRIRGEIAGTVVFYHRAPHRFTETEKRLGAALGNLAAAALGTAELYDKELQLREQAERAERRASFLAETGALLSSSLDYETTLKRVAEAAVPIFAEWCSVDVLDEAGELRRVAIAHPDPAQVEFAIGFRRKYPPRETDPLLTALRSGRSVLVEELTDEMLVLGARSPEHLEDVRKLGIRSLIVVPMIARGRALGTLTFGGAVSLRRYRVSDVAFAEEVALRAATAIDNARLFTESRLAREASELSNEELRRANADLEQFAYSASHDLREPLRMISIYSQALQRHYGGNVDANVELFLRYIASGARRMEALIADLLEYTRVASSSPAKPVVPMDAEEALSHVLENLKRAIDESGAVILRNPLPKLLVHEVHLTQLFQNIIENAIKYRSAAPPRILIHAARDGEQWRISISDNGIGFVPQYADTLFGLFKRLHTSDKYSGTGIGLALCQKIVHRYSGRIWAESNGEGTGATFSFTLPAGETLT